MRYVLGVDEVHRGSLVGPVFAGACLLKFGQVIDGATDSKKLREDARYSILEKIKNEAIASACAHATHAEIDSVNIKTATKMAMLRAIQAIVDSRLIPRDADLEIIIDGNEIFDFDDLDGESAIFTMEMMNTAAAIRSALYEWPRIESVVKADLTCTAASCASIVAKCEADRWLSSHVEAEKFDWKNNHGYATKAHADLIRKHGKPSIYRESFKLPGS